METSVPWKVGGVPTTPQRQQQRRVLWYGQTHIFIPVLNHRKAEQGIVTATELFLLEGQILQ